MFHRARTVCRPVKLPMLTVCCLVAPGWAPPSLKEASSVPPMKYSQVAVECRAVRTQLKVTVRPTVAYGQGLLLSLSTAKREPPPLQSVEPLGASALCGSEMMSPQPATAPLAQLACRLGGDEM